VTRIDRYLLRESVPPLLFGLLLYAGLAVISTTLPRLQWVVGTPIARLAGWLLLQLPTAMEQTLPIALVLAVLLAFGRLGSDNELLAMQAGTVSLLRMSSVFVVAGVLAAGGALALNQWVLPSTNGMVARQYWQLTAGASGLFRLAGQNVPVGDFTLRFQNVDNRTDTMLGVRVERWQGQDLTLLRAKSATFQGTDLVLKGYDLTVLDFSALDRLKGDPQQALSKLVQVINRPANPNATLTLTTSLTEKDLISRFSGGGFEDTRSISGAWHDAHDASLSYHDRRQAAVLFQRMLAEPFANLTLLLVAIPLALLYAGSRGVAFGLSLVVTLVWYVFLTFGQLFSQTGALPVWLGPWLGNLVLAAIGVFLLARRVSLR
jgi:lipopolysaccharide export system permease protein